MLPASVDEVFLRGGSGSYAPYLLGRVRLHHSRASHGLDSWEEQMLLSRLEEGDNPVWDAGVFEALEALDLAAEPEEPATFTALPPGSVTARRFRSYKKALKAHTYQHRPRTLWQCKALKLRSEPDESKADFAARVQLAAREKRDAAVDKLRSKFAKRLAQLERRIARAEQRIAREKSQ